MRYLGSFQRGTLRDSLKSVSLTPMKGFRYSVLEVTNALLTVSSQEQVDILMCEGFSGHQLISQLHDHTVHNDLPIDRFPTEPSYRWKTLA